MSNSLDTPMVPDASPWERIKNFSVLAHQELVDGLNRSRSVGGSDDLAVERTPSGPVIVNDHHTRYWRRVIGVIVVPESGTYTYTDARYRLKVLRITSYSGAIEDMPTLDYETGHMEFPDGGTEPGMSMDIPIGATVTALNLVEHDWATPANGTHYLSENSTVIVEAWVEYDLNLLAPSPKWFFERIPDMRDIDVMLDAAAQDGSNKRWKYTGHEVEKTAVGYTGWTTKSGGWTATGATNGIYIYNRAEVGNGASGLYGNGVSSTNLTGTFDIQPVPTGRPWRLRIYRFKVSSTWYTEGWIQVANGIDGACP